MTTPRPVAARDDVVRRWWARFLESKVERDGQVHGFLDWWRRATEFARSRSDLRAHRAASLVTRDGLELDAAIDQELAAFRSDLRAYREPGEFEDHEYRNFRLALVHQVRRDGLRPFEVAALLEREHQRFPAIPDDEVALYRHWHDEWGGAPMEGDLVWNPLLSRLQPWPHPEILVYDGRPGQPPRGFVPIDGGEKSLDRNRGSAPVKALPAATTEDQPPPAEYR